MKTIDEEARNYSTWKTYKGEETVSQHDVLTFKAGVEFAQRWIPIEEELPNENDYVLAIVDGNFGNKNQCDWVVVSLYSDSRFINYYDHKISHWRPIEYK